MKSLQETAIDPKSVCRCLMTEKHMLNQKCYGKIFDIQHFSVGDGPGIRTTVFLKGCPLRCIWCHNPESQNTDEEYYINGEKIGQTITAEEVLQELLKDKVFYETSGGGVTISGGEPLFQLEFTTEILRLCKEKGIHTAIETGGFASPDHLCSVLKYCDLVLFDIKETNEEKHMEYIGAPLAVILQNLKIVNDTKVPFVIRLPIIPGINDREDHFLKVKDIAGELVFCRGIEILPYHKLGEYKYRQLGREYLCQNIIEPSKDDVEKWKSLLK